ncbi:MAG: hypothetical protein JWO36_7298 [Myxococcales bacterium]|nr:hypothetical protein [Myxococcales bacterium]
MPEQVEGESSEALTKQEEIKPPELAHDKDNDLTAAGSIDVAGQQFQWSAKGLWAGVVVCFGFTLAVARMDPFPQKIDMMFLLGTALGGMLCTRVMHGRLADNRAELARVRADLDRKATEYSKLQSKFLKNAQSSRRNKPKRKGE